MTITINILDAGIIKNPDTGADVSQYAVFSITNDADAPPGPFLYGRGGIDTSETDIQGLLDSEASSLWTGADAVQNEVVPARFFNYVITPSVASNNLTVALKTLTGDDISITQPLALRIGNDMRLVITSLSTTKNAGTNWFNSGSAELATNAVDYFVYLIQETGASAGTKIGFARVPYARTMGDFTNTTTSEKYIAGSWTNFNSTDPVALIGRFTATLSAGAGYTWSSPGTVVNRPIYDTQWLTYVPTVTAAAGTITTVGAVSGAYQVAYNRLFFNHLGTITTNGTGATAVRLSLPFTPASDNSVGAGRENAATGAMLQSRAASNYMEYFTTANAYPGGDGRVIKGGGIALKLI